MQCHIFVTCSTRPRIQGWKALQKPHFSTFGENVRQHWSQKKSSISGPSQPPTFSALHSMQLPETWPTFCVANSLSLKPSRSLSMREPKTCPTVGFSHPSKMTRLCNDGKL